MPRLYRDVFVEAEFADPPLARWLFKNVVSAWLWLPIRVYVGFQWLLLGHEHLSDPTWVGGGAALRALWLETVLVPPSPEPPTLAHASYVAVVDGLLDLGAEDILAKLIVFAELLVGISLIAGAFVGLTAFLGVMMNMTLLLAGVGSADPLAYAAAIGLVLAWRVAGYLGLDRLLLPSVGVPWTRSGPGRPPSGGAAA